MYSIGMSKAPDTAVTRRGQTVIPAAIRRRHGIEEGDRIVWLDDGATIRVIPIPSDPVAELRGAGRGEGLAQELLAERGRDRERDA
jgi:AbrB family looped-hinge helix DNA binding protein